MEQIPSFEVTSSLTVQEISHTLWNPKVHYYSYKNPSTATNLCQMKPVHTFPPIYMRPILIASSVLHLGFPSGLFPQGFHTNTVLFFFYIFNTKCHTQKHKILCPLNHKTTTEQQQTACMVPSVFYYYDEVQKT